MTAWFRLLLSALIAVAGGTPVNAQLSFTRAQNLGDAINTPSIEVGPNLSADGLTMYFVSDRPGGLSGSAELWMSTRAAPGAPWRVAVNVGPPVNRYAAASPSVSSDGLELFFDNGLRVRPGGQGGGDIWFARRPTASGKWDEPQNIGPVVNSPFNDGVPKLSRDGLTLFFSSDRPGGAGRRDIWVTSRATRAGPWTAPLNLGAAVNGPANDWCPAISADGLMLIFQSDRPGSFGGDDFWMSTRTSTSAPWSTAVHLGPEINTSADEAKAEFSADGRMLLFASARPGGRGALDIWEIPIERVTAPAVAGPAQQPLPSRAFEVVSVKPNQSGDAGSQFRVEPGGRVTWTNVTLSAMVSAAYQRFQWDSREIVGGPGWFNEARFDVVALAPNGLPRPDADGFPSQLLAMIRAVLADRFRLEAHWEPREGPVYNLVLDRADRRLGPKLVPAAVDCAKVAAATLAGAPPAPRPGRGRECNLSLTSEPGSLQGNAVTMAVLGRFLTAEGVGREVVDRTGLSGTFDLDVLYLPEVASGGASAEKLALDPKFQGRAGLITSLREQLGLKLEPSRAPVEVLVIDAAERPREN